MRLQFVESVVEIKKTRDGASFALYVVLVRVSAASSHSTSTLFWPSKATAAYCNVRLYIQMTKRKVIEDSDDDENVEASPPRPLATGLSDITLSTLISLNSSPSHEIQEQSGDPSASSSGSCSFRCLHFGIDYKG